MMKPKHDRTRNGPAAHFSTAAIRSAALLLIARSRGRAKPKRRGGEEPEPVAPDPVRPVPMSGGAAAALDFT